MPVSATICMNKMLRCWNQWAYDLFINLYFIFNPALNSIIILIDSLYDIGEPLPILYFMVPSHP
jgi:hypothetical protein